MRSTFRQGIAKYQTDVYATPTFLQKSSQNGEFVDLIISPDPTIIIFAHKSATYVIEEIKTIHNAWGPFPGNVTRYLYWDINLLDASITRSFTSYPQLVSATEPSSPAVDQHWFDTVNHLMKVWNGSKWLDKVRVFAATYSSQAVIQPAPLGTQAGETGSFEGGNLVLDSYNKPLRQSDGTFVTSATELSIINSSTKKVNFETEIVSGMADENIPKYSWVQAAPGRKFKLARSDNWKSRIIGLIDEDLYTSEVGNVETSGLIRNEQWNWPFQAVGRPIFCGTTGEITLVPPRVGVLQVAGYVLDKDSIYVNIQNVTILNDVRNETLDTPVGPVGARPTADFTATPVIGTAPLFVQFKDTSVHAPTAWEWDVRNDGTIDSTAKEPGYNFTTAGTYAVRLVARNEFGEDEVIKTGFITVNPPVALGINTNLDIQLSAVLQVAQESIFPITVTVSNAGLRTATNVERTIVIDDVDNDHVEITTKPTGSIVSHVGNTTTLAFPLLASLLTGNNAVVTFSLVAPEKVGVINIRAGVNSPENDSELGDNTATLSIRVK